MTAHGSASARWRLALLGTLAAAGIVGAFALERIAQDPAYHRFADARSFFGVPNFWNVATNLPFALVGLLGIVRRGRLRAPELRLESLTYCAGTILVAFGSGYYHWTPSTPTLAWDRLPMTVAFMALFALVVRDRLGKALPAPIASRLLWPLLALGAASVAWWAWSEAAGRGDLRPYLVVQFLPMLLLPAILLLFDGRGLSGRWLVAALAGYALAKVAETLDRPLLEATQLLSGHSVKHLTAAVAAYCVVRAAIGHRPRSS